MIAGSIRPRQAELVSDPAFSNTVPSRHRMRREAVMPPKSNPALSLRSIIAVTRGQLTFAQAIRLLLRFLRVWLCSPRGSAWGGDFLRTSLGGSPGVSLGGPAGVMSG